TPDQVFEVYFDTGSDFLWVAGKDCTGCEQFQGRTFDGTQSSTYSKTTEPFTAEYGDHKKADGVYIIETFRLGADANDQLAIANLKFGEATQLTPSPDGKIFSNPASVGLTPSSPIVQALKEHQLLDENIFTIFYKFRKGSEQEAPAGVVSWGAHDTENCGSIIGSAPVGSGNGFWGPDVDALIVGSRQIGDKYTTLPDTANSVIRFPREVYQAVLEESGADAQGKVDCNTDFSVTLKLSGVDVVLTRKSLVQRNWNGDTCSLHMREIPSKTSTIKLGLNLFKEFCLVHDFSGDIPKLGFAETKE
ncbi:Protein ASP-5, partial [Aphelenchoides avenae]